MERTARPIREDYRSFSQHSSACGPGWCSKKMRTTCAALNPCLLKTTTFSLKDYKPDTFINLSVMPPGRQTDNIGANLAKSFEKHNVIHRKIRDPVLCHDIATVGKHVRTLDVVVV